MCLMRQPNQQYNHIQQFCQLILSSLINTNYKTLRMGFPNNISDHQYNQSKKISQSKNSIRKKVKQIPQIKLQLDDLLNDAYYQIKMEPKRHHLLGSQDTCPKLNNQLLKEYVNQIYKEYNIPDPLSNFTAPTTHRKDFSRLSNRYSSTPAYDKPTQKKSKSRTVIAKLKLSMKKQLSNGYNSDDEAEALQPVTLRSKFQRSDSSERQFPIKKSLKKTRINLKSKNKRHDLQQSHSSRNSVNHNSLKFCLFCENPISSLEVKDHVQFCNETLNFIRVYNNRPALSVLIEGIKRKISELSTWLLKESTSFSQEGLKLALGVQKYIRNQEDDFGDQFSPIHIYRKDFQSLLKNQGSSMKALYQQSKIIKCYRQIEHYQYLREVYQQFTQLKHRINEAQDLPQQIQRQANQVQQKYLGFQCQYFQ